MSMSTRVTAFKGPDSHWQKMKNVWDACISANVEPPQEVYAFFDGMAPDPAGVEVKIPFEEWTDRDTVSEGITIQVKDIPKDVVTIKFTNSY